MKAKRVVPLKIRLDVRAYLLKHPKYRRQDTVNLALEAKAYVQGRLPVPDKETAIAILLSRDER
jgi:hypothetical protein